MDKIFQIGDFTFRLCCPDEITPPPNFVLFERGDTGSVSGGDGAGEAVKPQYTYRMHVASELPEPEGKSLPADRILWCLRMSAARAA